jgi:hypothetical protein
MLHPLSSCIMEVYHRWAAAGTVAVPLTTLLQTFRFYYLRQTSSRGISATCGAASFLMV